MNTRLVVAATADERERAVALTVEHLRRGDPVALPTETVYGLAADALNPDAAVKIFEAKERPRFDPLIVHLPDEEWLRRVVVIDATNEELIGRLTDACWPGPLTIVLQRRDSVPDIVTSGLETVAVRISAHPLFGHVMRTFGRPLAAPSANRFGRISPTTAAHVLAELDGRIPLIVDGGATTHGLESTIVAVRNGAIEILRQGPVTNEQLTAFAEVRIATIPLRPEAPGQLSSHYAPITRLVLTTSLETFRPGTNQRTGALAWRTVEAARFAESRILSSAGDLREAAANLFRCLRELDSAGLDLIVAEQVPDAGLGSAIMDRLRRAAA